MTTSERRKIFCSVTFHVIAVTCVVWSLYVLIDRTAEEIKQGNDNGKDLSRPLSLPPPDGTQVCTGSRFQKVTFPLGFQVGPLSKSQNLATQTLQLSPRSSLSKEHGPLGIPTLGLGMRRAQAKLGCEGCRGSVYHSRLPEAP